MACSETTHTWRGWTYGSSGKQDPTNRPATATKRLSAILVLSHTRVGSVPRSGLLLSLIRAPVTTDEARMLVSRLAYFHARLSWWKRDRGPKREEKKVSARQPLSCKMRQTPRHSAKAVLLWQVGVANRPSRAGRHYTGVGALAAAGEGITTSTFARMSCRKRYRMVLAAFSRLCSHWCQG